MPSPGWRGAGASLCHIVIHSLSMGVSRTDAFATGHTAQHNTTQRRDTLTRTHPCECCIHFTVTRIQSYTFYCTVATRLHTQTRSSTTESYVLLFKLALPHDQTSQTRSRDHTNTRIMRSAAYDLPCPCAQLRHADNEPRQMDGTRAPSGVPADPDLSIPVRDILLTSG